MTDIERLADAIGKHRGFGSYTAFRIADNLFYGREALGLSVDQLHGLVEGTYVAVLVEPDEDLEYLIATAMGIMLDSPLHKKFLHAYEVVIKAAQEEGKPND